MKRAYLELALRFRPDQVDGLSPDERERAEFRRNELNAAWSVLRSPAARARYDDELRAREAGGSDDAEAGEGAGVRTRATVTHGRAAATSATAPPGSPTGVDAGSGGVSTADVRIDLDEDRRARAASYTALSARERDRTGAPERDAGHAADAAQLHASRGRGEPRAAVDRRRRGVHVDPETESAARLEPADREPEPEAPRWIRWLPGIVGGAVLVVVLVVAGLSYGKNDRGLGVKTVEAFGVGTCVAATMDDSEGVEVVASQGPTRVITVPCAFPHMGKIVSRQPFPLSCPVGRPLVLPEAKESICIV